MRRAEALLHIGGQLFHLRGVRHVHLARQHLRACGLHLGGGGVQSILLHIHQHQVHAEAGTDARAFQAKARACASEDGGFAGKVVDHVVCLLGVIDG